MSELEPIFRTVLRDVFDQLHPAHQDLHDVLTYRRWEGRALVRRGQGMLAQLAGWLSGFPPVSEDTPVVVEMERTGSKEIWTRTFGAKQFRSYLSAKPTKEGHRLCERFGVMAFEIDLTQESGALSFPVSGGALLGIPIPNALLPLSDAREFVDADGQVCFHVSVSLPLVGHIATYKGWLHPADEQTI